ncbi:hypothetical protein AVEN_144893-1 [Araneus ventricosus]|uniref:Uncharacterized protein n=1 Tax=Araneus ventricosus TaxID=182803 RepID=A0A4Y2EHI8_ARAVE|nr:hypothetical protein AVEN_144893-1 [Araneus ventricosus]
MTGGSGYREQFLRRFAMNPVMEQAKSVAVNYSAVGVLWKIRTGSMESYRKMKFQPSQISPASELDDSFKIEREWFWVLEAKIGEDMQKLSVFFMRAIAIGQRNLPKTQYYIWKVSTASTSIKLDNSAPMRQTCREGHKEDSVGKEISGRRYPKEVKRR